MWHAAPHGLSVTTFQPHETVPPLLLTLSTAAISGMVLWSALLTMGVIRPLGVATATETSTVEETMDLPATGSHTEFTSGINWEWVRYAQIPGIHSTHPKYSHDHATL